MRHGHSKQKNQYIIQSIFLFPNFIRHSTFVKSSRSDCFDEMTGVGMLMIG